MGFRAAWPISASCDWTGDCKGGSISSVADTCFLKNTVKTNLPNFYLTSIVSDNARSIRLLERGLPELPAYPFLGGFVTLIIPVSKSIASAHRMSGRVWEELHRQGAHHVTASNDQFSNLARFLDGLAEGHQLAARWTPSDLDGLLNFGIKQSDYHIVLNGTTILGCVAVWDQRQFRQTVIRGYNRKLALVRPVAQLEGTVLWRLAIASSGFRR